MKKFVTRFIVPALALALLTAPFRPASAQQEQAKPAFVISVASINEQLTDVSYLLRAAGQEQFIPILEFGAPVYADGFDKKRPFGAIVNFAMGQPSVTAFAPVADLNKVLMKFQDRTGEPEDVGGGIKKLTTPEGKDVFIKESKGWAHISNVKDNLAAVPDDPSQALGALPSQYNVAVQMNVQSIPAPLRQMAIDKFKEGFASGLQGVEDEGIDAATAKGVESIEQLINESEQVTFGWNIDAMRRTTHIDFGLTAVAGTKLAERMKVLQNTTTNYAGFLMSDAAVNLNFVSVMAEEDQTALLDVLTRISTQAMTKMDEDDNLDAASRATMKDVVGTIIGALKKTIEGGRLDGGAAVLIDGKKVAFVAGGKLADTKGVDGSVRKIIELAKHEPKFKGTAQLDAETHANISFHKITQPVPDKDEARDILGETLEVYIGAGGGSVYLALGQNSWSKLKEVIDVSAASADKKVPPSQMTVALLPILKFAAKFPEGAALAPVVAKLEQNMGMDKIRLSSHAIERGGQTRIELEEGALQGIGAAVQAVMKGLQGGGADLGDDF